MSSATQILTSTEPFHFRRGGSIPQLSLAYETWGRLNRNHSNAVLILTGISPSAHAASNDLDPEEGWWEEMVGEGKPIDSREHFVICINSLGSCKGSTGPASINPETGQLYRLDFPEITIWDIAASAHRVLQHLGITQLRALVGPSMGGMSGLAWLYQNSRGARHFLGVSTAACAEPFSIAIRSLQREAIVTDPGWQNGNYDADKWPQNGMRLARKLGMISYRSAREWRTRFGRKEQTRIPPQIFGMNYEVESYLENAAQKFVPHYDPCAYVGLSRAMDWFNLADGHASLQQAMAHIELQSGCVIGVDSDILFPLHQQQAIADALQGNGVRTQMVCLPSDEGHDAFLVDYARFNPVIAEYFARILADEDAA